jgi:hypothetical protein
MKIFSITYTKINNTLRLRSGSFVVVVEDPLVEGKLEFFEGGVSF